MKNLGDTGGFLETARQIARSHHEKWDGSGYPDGLAGTAIPLPARMMAVADVYDAVRSERPYKKGMSHDEAFAILREGRGSHFDPQIVDVFLCFDEKVQQIREQWTDRSLKQRSWVWRDWVQSRLCFCCIAPYTSEENSRMTSPLLCIHCL
jgi:putative two-component system response regulator